MNDLPKYKLGDVVIYIGRKTGRDQYEYGQGIIDNALYKGKWEYWISKAGSWVREVDIKNKL